MYNLLAETQNLGNLILIIVLLVACAGMFILSYFRNKKYSEQQKQMLNEIKEGTKVLTKTFIYGTVEKITDTTDGKIVLLKTGEGDKVSYLEMNLEAIYSVDNKEEVVDLEEVINDEEATVAFEENKEVDVEEPVKTETKKTTRKTKK